MKRRFAVHWNDFSNTVLSRTIKKYGKNKFTVNIIDNTNTWQEACIKEKYYIQKYNTRIPIGMNMTSGGDGIYGLRHSVETRKQMAISHIGKGIGKDNPMYGKTGSRKNVKLTEEIKRKIAETRKKRIQEGLIIPWNKGKKIPQITGEKNPFYGRHHTKETKQKMAKAKLGKKLSKETKTKMSKSRIEKYQGEKHPQAKLKNKDIMEIRKLYKTKNYTQKQLSIKYNVTQSMIGYIINYKSWKHII